MFDTGEDVVGDHVLERDNLWDTRKMVARRSVTPHTKRVQSIASSRQWNKEHEEKKKCPEGRQAASW
jgi:hypothetical protein